MKKTIRVMALVLALTAVLFVFASCGKTLSGTYSAEIDIAVLKYTATYEFKGSKVTATKVTNPLIGESKTTVLEGTYEIVENDDGSMDITLNFETADDEIKSGTFDFEEGEDYIKIGLVTYNKK